MKSEVDLGRYDPKAEENQSSTATLSPNYYDGHFVGLSMSVCCLNVCILRIDNALAPGPSKLTCSFEKEKNYMK